MREPGSWMSGRSLASLSAMGASAMALLAVFLWARSVVWPVAAIAYLPSREAILLDLLTAFSRLIFVLMFLFGYPSALSRHTSRVAEEKIGFPLTFFLTIGVMAALILLPPPAYTVGIASFMLASLLLWRRWELPIRFSLVLCAYWPATAVFALQIARAQEGRRRDRIVHEIMET